MWFDKPDYHTKYFEELMENSRLKMSNNLLKAELKHYKDREAAAPSGCMSGTHCAGCKNVIITGPEEKRKYDCKLVAAKLCDRFEEATP